MRNVKDVVRAAVGLAVVVAAAAWTGDRPEPVRLKQAAATAQPARLSPAASPNADVGAMGRAERALANLPVAFVENRGQTDSRVR